MGNGEMKLNRYPKYKPTGIAWLPELPEGWEVVRLKNVLRERVEKSSTGLEEPLSMSQKRGIVPTREMDVVPNAASSYVGAKKVYVNDIVFNKLKAHLGVFAISAYDGLVSPDYAVYTSRGLISRKYLEYLFHTPLYITEFRRKSTGIAIGLTRLYTKDLYSIYGVCPPTGVQRAIVAFLDEKCGKIDRWVAAKEREMALLKELKQAMIAEAVTRGVRAISRVEVEKWRKSGLPGSGAEPQIYTSTPLHGSNPRPLVPSGIPWLPEVPEGWEVKRLKGLFSLRRESYSPNEQLQVLSLIKDVGVIPYEEKGQLGNKSKEDISGYNVARKGDIVMNSMNVIIGSVDITPFDGYISPAYYALTARQGVETKYFNYLFHLTLVQKMMRSLAKGILEIRLRISITSLLGMSFPLPPLAEQRAIVAYIEARAAKIDAAVAGLEREVAAMKEYKQRLIADVVTGQRKVA